MPNNHLPAPIVVMGVSGAGKSTIAKTLAEKTASVFIEGDDYHPIENKQKIASGIALVDEDRWPWLTKVASAIESEPVSVTSCSALRESYRQFIRERSAKNVKFVLLDLPAEEVKKRLEARKGHFATASILQSQFETLEVTADLHRVDASQSIDEICCQILALVQPS